MRRIIDRSRLRTVIATVIAASAVAGIAQAAIPSTSDNVISGCYDSRGKLRVVDAQAGAKCAATEKPLSWNQQGPAGPPGSKGDPGGLAGYQVVRDASGFSAADTRTLLVNCPDGTRPVGGGGEAIAAPGTINPTVAITQSTSVRADAIGINGWVVSAREFAPISTPDGWRLSGQAICASVGE